jgi:transposase-like protein
MGEIVQLNEEEVKRQLSSLVRGTVEETLNRLLDEEADRITNAHRYERTEERLDTRAGHYERRFLTTSGEVTLKMPKLRTLPFETSIIERYKRREESVEEALIEMYLAGVSVRRVEDISEALWGSKVSPGTISDLNKKVYVQIEEWRSRPLKCEYRYVHLDGFYLKRNWGGSVENVAVLVALGVNAEGTREIIGACEGGKEDTQSWLSFLRQLKERGLRGVRMFIGDKCLGLVEAIGEVFPESAYQRCIVHFYRNVFSVVPKKHVKVVAAMLKAIHAQESREAAMRKGAEVAQTLRGMKLPAAAKKVEEGLAETLTYTKYPREHWIRIRTNNGIERIMKEIRRRTRVVGSFPDGHSALMLVCARLRHISASAWGEKKYLNMAHLYEMEKEAALNEVSRTSAEIG